MICSQCNKEFTKTHHRQKYCSKECNQKKYNESEKGRDTRKKYSQTSKSKETKKRYQKLDSYQEFVKEYHQTDEYKKSSKKYRQSVKGKAVAKKHRSTPKGLATGKRVYEKRQSKGLNAEQQSRYGKKRRKSDPIYKLTGNIRTRLNQFYKAKNIRKTNPTFKMVGCTPEFLKKYLEKKFKPGMTWKNHTLHGWHVDHIIPLSSVKTLEDKYKLCHYTNLQPMWATENIKKSNKII